MVPAAHKSFTGSEQQGDCEDAEDASTSAPRKEHVEDAMIRKVNHATTQKEAIGKLS